MKCKTCGKPEISNFHICLEVELRLEHYIRSQNGRDRLLDTLGRVGPEELKEALENWPRCNWDALLSVIHDCEFEIVRRK